MKLITKSMIFFAVLSFTSLLIFFIFNFYNYKLAMDYELRDSEKIVAQAAYEVEDYKNEIKNFALSFAESGLGKKFYEPGKFKSLLKADKNLLFFAVFDSKNSPFILYPVNRNYLPAGEIVKNADLAAKASSEKKGVFGKITCIEKPVLPYALPVGSGNTAVFYFALKDFAFDSQSSPVFILDSSNKPLACGKTVLSDLKVSPFERKDSASFLTLDGVYINGRKRIASAKTDPELDWAFVAPQDDDFLNGGLKRSFLLFLAFTFLIAGFSVAAAFLINKNIVKPVEELSSSVKVFSDTHILEEPVDLSGWPEIKTLISNVNRLMLELQAYKGFQLDRIMEERNKAQVLADTVPDAILLLDPDNRLIYSNSRAVTLLGIKKRIKDEPIISLIEDERFARALTKALSSAEKIFRAEVELKTDEKKNYSRIYMLIAKEFVLSTLNKNGRAVIIRDITYEKEMEKAKEDFFHMITHDMRAPLSTIQGYAEMLRKKMPITEYSEKYFKNILYSAKKMGGMIDDILNTSKLQRGAMTLKLEKISAGDLLERVREHQAVSASARNIYLKIALPEHEIVFHADPSLMERVLTNLVGNSIKFTPPGGEIRLGVYEEKYFIKFYVQDNGPGIPQDKRDYIFNKYTQLEDHKSRGFGLGLAMCKMTVELHEGKIWIESAPGGGSIFFFTVSRKLSQGEQKS